MPERRSAVETETRDTQDGELHREYISFLATRIVSVCLVDSGHFTARKGRGVEARRMLSIGIRLPGSLGYLTPYGKRRK